MQATAIPLADPAPSLPPLLPNHALPQNLRQALWADVQRGALELPILPEAASQVVSLTEREDCDALKIANVIRQDQSIATHLLRLANSPLYRPTTPIVSLQQAISRLGFNAIKQIVLCIACQGRVFQVKGFENEVRYSFRHSLATALFCQEIARITKTNVEDAFLMGLLHNIGVPILLQKIVDLQKKLACIAERPAIFASIDQYHAHVGAAAITQWKLSEKLAQTVAYHHHESSPEPYSVGVALIQFASALAEIALDDTDTEFAIEQLREHPALIVLNLYPDTVDLLLNKRSWVADTVLSM